MKYEYLEDFILHKMDMRPGKNYQPVMIKALNQNKGKISKEDLKIALQKENPKTPVFVKISKDSNSGKNHPLKLIACQ